MLNTFFLTRGLAGLLANSSSLPPDITASSALTSDSPDCDLLEDLEPGELWQ